MNHLGTTELFTERLHLRPFRVSDAEAAFRNWCRDPEVTKYLTWPTHGSAAVTEAVFQDWVSHYGEPDYYQWAIVPRSLGEPIGSIAVVEQKPEADAAQIGYCIGRSWWHQGYTTEAYRAVISYLFRQVGFQRIESRHDPRNPNSGGVMRKCGMTYEGTLRQADRNNQGIADASFYSILRREYEPSRL